MRWILSLVFIFLSLYTYAVVPDNGGAAVSGRAEHQEKKGKFSYRGFSGGMALHTGYVTTGDFQVFDTEGNALGTFNGSGMPTGIGGSVRFQFGKYFRAGSEGYVTTLKYNGNGSYCTTGWGGILAEFHHDFGPATLFAGLDFGVGGFKHVLVTGERNEHQTVTENIMYDRYPVLITAPYIGTEIKVKGSFRILLKADYIMNVLSPGNTFTKGVRIYVGFVFARLHD